VALLTSKIELAFFDWVQVGRGLSEELGSELHRQRNFFWVKITTIKDVQNSDSDRRVQPTLTRTAMKTLHQRYTLWVSNSILICGLLNSPYAGSLNATTRTSSSRKEMPSH
jgi:hypothetical protein